MLRFRGRLPAVLVLATSMVSGCMSFRQGRQFDGEWPMRHSEPRPRVSVVLRHETIIGGKQTEPNPTGTEILRQTVLRAYNDAQIFGGVRPGMAAGGGELQVDVTIVNRGDPNIGLAVLSGLTLTLLPAVATDNFTMRTAVRNPEGTVLAEVEHGDAMTTWIQLFLVFGTIAASPNSVAEATLYDLTRTSIHDLHARGVW